MPSSSVNRPPPSNPNAPALPPSAAAAGKHALPLDKVGKKGSVVRSYAALNPRTRLYLSLATLGFAATGLYLDGKILQEQDVVYVVPPSSSSRAGTGAGEEKQKQQ